MTSTELYRNLNKRTHPEAHLPAEPDGAGEDNQEVDEQRRADAKNIGNLPDYVGSLAGEQNDDAESSDPVVRLRTARTRRSAELS
ncbi:hypothetical protein HBH56_135170 [Parastagonospora nodorum]|nr:hypothetical protein HBH56_135170 [Parastagonospora nodorum]KAH3958849.1 hypothetical protein HBH51_205380 [Parastagonospora nodorum]KAH4048487.1 hypothetical protein HBH49_159360 [Parastagonospora nodorum]KAH4086220.1 hypothetical protein HBH48_147860 [Parastagonospora nodorum]KAH4119953.1 hypothetical protein HBH47_119280 [Parastagonospora nodorum]